MDEATMTELYREFFREVAEPRNLTGDCSREFIAWLRVTHPETDPNCPDPDQAGS